MTGCWNGCIPESVGFPAKAFEVLIVSDELITGILPTICCSRSHRPPLHVIEYWRLTVLRGCAAPLTQITNADWNCFDHSEDLVSPRSENMAAISRFHGALQANQTDEVQMNQVRFTQFSAMQAVGTQRLNGCTAVAVVSNLGTILAHIPPLPFATPNPHAGIQNLRARMTEVVALYQQHHNLFRPEAASLVVMAIFGGQIALADHIHEIRQILSQYNLPPKFSVYEVTQGGLQGPAAGTVFIDARHGPPVVYIEDRQVILS